MRTCLDHDPFPSASRAFRRADLVSDLDDPVAVDVNDRTMDEEHESTDSGGYVDPVAGTIAGRLPVTLAVDSRSLKGRAVVCAVPAAASL